jgi:hypothetical protein
VEVLGFGGRAGLVGAGVCCVCGCKGDQLGFLFGVAQCHSDVAHAVHHLLSIDVLVFVLFVCVAALLLFFVFGFVVLGFICFVYFYFHL